MFDDQVIARLAGDCAHLLVVERHDVIAFHRLSFGWLFDRLTPAEDGLSEGETDLGNHIHLPPEPGVARREAHNHMTVCSTAASGGS
jgi:hypothetical protein